MNKEKTMTIMITGAGGFLGRELMHQIITNTNYNAILLTSKKEDMLGHYSYTNRLKYYELRNWNQCNVVWSDIDVIVHCAFSRSNDGSSLAKSIEFTNNLFITAQNNGVKAIINISSQSVYGDLPKPLWREEIPVSPNSIYAISKYATEIITKNISFNNIVKATSIRLASLLGPGLDIRIVSRFVKDAIIQQRINVEGGNRVLSFLDVRDAASGLLALVSLNSECWKEIYNLGSPERYTIYKIAEIVKRTAEIRGTKLVNIVREKEDCYLDSGMDSNLFYKDTGWKPKYDMEAIVESLFEYFIRNLKAK